MIFITPLEFEPSGVVALQPNSNSDEGTVRRRSTRVGTLDGGAVFTDHGFTDADRTISIGASCDAGQDAKLRRMVETHSLVKLSTRDGLYLCQMEYKPGRPSARLTFRIIERMSEGL